MPNPEMFTDTHTEQQLLADAIDPQQLEATHEANIAAIYEDQAYRDKLTEAKMHREQSDNVFVERSRHNKKLEIAEAIGRQSILTDFNRKALRVHEARHHDTERRSNFA